MKRVPESTPPQTAAGHEQVAPTIGSVGLGIVGQPMALNLARAGTRLVVWNRPSDRCAPLCAAGAAVAALVAEVFARADIVLVDIALRMGAAERPPRICEHAPKAASRSIRFASAKSGSGQTWRLRIARR